MKQKYDAPVAELYGVSVDVLTTSNQWETPLVDDDEADDGYCD